MNFLTLKTAISRLWHEGFNKIHNYGHREISELVYEEGYPVPTVTKGTAVIVTIASLLLLIGQIAHLVFRIAIFDRAIDRK